MISRTLVPMDARPLSAAPERKPPRRLSSALDDRIVVTQDMAVKPLDTRTSIPSHVPLGVLTTRTLVPRDMPIQPLEPVPEFPDYLPLDILESRIVVPRDVDPVGKIQEGESRLFEETHPLSLEEEEILEPDILTTGEVNLLNRSVEERGVDWRSISRAGSIGLHILILVLAFFSAVIFPHHEPTAEDEALARQQLNFIYMPPSVSEPPRAQAPSPNIKISPDTIRRVAPPTEPPPGRVANNFSPTPQPELPSAPVPRPSTSDAPPSTQPSAPVPHSPSALPDSPKPSLSIPDVSPGRALKQSAQQALQNGPTAGTRGFEDRVSPRGGGAGGGGGGQGGSTQAQLGGNIEMLTPTDGVDFTDYFNRLLASVRRNWYAIIPESARLGDRGKVVIQFHINRDGSVPALEPVLVRTSSKQPLDRAAMAAIHASNPFEPLPSAFTRPNIEIRFTFLYNLPLDAQ